MGAFRLRDTLGGALQSGRTFSLKPGQGDASLIRIIVIACLALAVFVAFDAVLNPVAYFIAPRLQIAPVEFKQYLYYLIGGYALIRSGRALYLRGRGKGKNQPPARTDRPRLEWRFMGSATFAYDAELARAGFYTRQPGGIPLGRFHRWHDNGRVGDDLCGDALWYNGDKHGLTIAPTRGGKGESFIIPTALTYEGSLFVIDPKGQCAAVTARHRARPRAEGGFGQKVYIFNPWNLHAPILNDPARNHLIRSAHFNPLEALVDADEADQLDGAMMLAEALIPKEAGESKPFFPMSARDLLVALILYVVTNQSGYEKSLYVVRQILTNPDALNTVLTEIMEYDARSIVRQKAARFAFWVVPQNGSDDGHYILSQQESVQDVYATAVVNTSLLDSPILARTMGDSDFSFEELKSATEPITVYLVIPASRIETYNRWLRLLVSVALQSLIDAKDKPQIPALFILDEFYQLGELQKVQDAMSLMAGYGVKLWPVIQDLNQLRARYGDRLWETFISNAGCIQMFKPNDNFTAEYFSKRMGEMTDWGFSTNESYANGTNRTTTLGGSTSPSGGSSSSSATTGTNSQYSESFTLTPHKRNLRNPDELTRMDRMQSFLFVDGAEIIQGERLRYHIEPSLKYLADADPEFYGIEKALELNGV